MLTPQEINDQCFSKAVFGGYAMREVDDFLEELGENYSVLYKENAVLKGKMKVLVKKIEEYRSTEDSMRKALSSAQTMAEDMINDAKKQSEDIENLARVNLSAELEVLRQAVEEEKIRLEEAKRLTAEFVYGMKELYLKQQEQLETIAFEADVISFSERKENARTEKVIDDTVTAIADSVEKEMSSMRNAENEEPKGLYSDAENANDTVDISRLPGFEVLPIRREYPDDDEDLAATRPKFNFNNLQFGKDYEIK